MKKTKVLLAKVGLDGHMHGLKLIATGLRDAGIEVVYLGLRKSPEQIVQAAIQEDVDGIGLSSLCGAHMIHFPRVIELLEQKGVESIKVFGGGIIPPEDIKKLKKMGVIEIFVPGDSLPEIVDFVKKKVKPRS
ncbi:MAG: cobalamin B12-binding domain-containing protein [Chloroflexi bacterium]|nr:cobalamin B12-binding domain-containing protein [Chloroflexota bacterium]